MNILIDLRVLSGPWSGIAVYTAELMNALQKSKDTPHTFYYILSKNQSFEKKNLSFLNNLSGTPLLLPYGVYDPRNIFSLNFIILKNKINLYFTTQYFWPFGILLCPVINMIHDIIPLTHQSLLARSKKTRMKKIFEWSTRLSLKKSFRTIVNSQTTLCSLENYFGKSPASKCRINYPSLSPLSPGQNASFRDLDLFNLKPSLYVLYVGRQDPYKNLFRLIEVWKKIKDKGFPHKLVIAGKKDPRYTQALETAHHLGMTDTVIFTDFVSSETLKTLYCGCHFVVQPSLAEGFGFTALESYLYGKTSMISDIPSFREIFGEEALWFNPFDSENMQEMLEKGLRMSDQELSFWSQKGMKRLELFTPERCLKNWLAILEEIQKKE